MRREFGILTAVLAMSALGVAADSPASAAAMPAYPVETPLLTTPTPSTSPGATVTLTAAGFAPGATVTFSIGGTTIGTAVANASGAASLAVTAPSTAGTYTVTASGGGATATLTLTVLAPGTDIPATGSESGNMARTAGVLVLVGVGLVGAAAIRRRSRALIAV